jgi:integral membrane sensor domain MASE1
LTAHREWYSALQEKLFMPLLTGVLSAFLGGMISVALSVGTADLQNKIPEMTHMWMVTILRPVVGALCAIPIVFLVMSEFLKFTGVKKEWMIALLCLATGFSERWFMGTFDQLLTGVKHG